MNYHTSPGLLADAFVRTIVALGWLLGCRRKRRRQNVLRLHLLTSFRELFCTCELSKTTGHPTFPNRHSPGEEIAGLQIQMEQGA